MNKFKQQIESVWKDTMTTAEKKQFLASFLQEESVWKASLEKAFRQDVAMGLQYLPAERSEKVLAQLHAQIRTAQVPVLPEEKGRVVRFTTIMKWAVAAAVVALLFTGYYLFQQQKGPQQEAPTTAVASDKLRLQTNESAINRDIQLEDGSVITLAPGSSIRYYEPFIEAKRDISLSGQAWFAVAKDALRPFTVYANDIATTALGTRFMVSTLIKDKVAIRLFEGKVVVKSTGKELTMKDVYLKPGEEFSIDRVLRQFMVKRFNEADNKQGPLVAGKELQKEKEVLPPLEFIQAPLTEVLLAIGTRYKVRFIYDEETIRNEQVTGRFLSSDSLETVLSILGTVNRLSFNKHHETITVSITQ